MSEYDIEPPYYMQMPYGEVSLNDWEKANAAWKAKQPLVQGVLFDASMYDEPVGENPSFDQEQIEELRAYIKTLT